MENKYTEGMAMDGKLSPMENQRNKCDVFGMWTSSAPAVSLCVYICSDASMYLCSDILY